MGTLLGLVIIVVCCLVIWKASDGFEDASDYIGRNLSDGVRGATINAIGSSMPELFTTFFFFFYYAYIIADPLKANDGFAGGIGTTAGSAIFNGMIIPAVVILAVIFYGLARKVNVSKKVILRDGLSLIFAEFILIYVLNGTTLYWWHGMILMMVYGIYVTVMFTTMSERENEEEDDADDYYSNEGEGSRLSNLLKLNLSPVFVKGEINTFNAWVLLLISMLFIGVACFFLVFACEMTAHGLGINTYFVAVILASAATSVPDTILSYRDAMKGEYDDAVANALGSNIFDVCFALGFPLMIFTLIDGPLEMSPDTINDVTELRVLLLILTVVAFFIYFIGQGMGKFKAILLLIIYLGFTTFIACKAYGLEWAIHFGDFLRSLIM